MKIKSSNYKDFKLAVAPMMDWTDLGATSDAPQAAHPPRIQTST